QLVREHQDPAYAIALLMLRDRDRAQDAVQDAFLVAFANLGTLRAPQAFGAWLRQIVRHQACRIMRRQPLEAALDQATPSSPADFADAVGQIVRVAGATANGVSAALARLGARPSGTEPLETGIKVIDLLCPMTQGGSVGLFGDPRVGKLVLVEEITHNIGQRR